MSAFITVFKKKVNAQCGTGSISMLISSRIHNAANRAIAKNSWQSYFKNFFLENNRVQQLLIEKFVLDLIIDLTMLTET